MPFDDDLMQRIKDELAAEQITERDIFMLTEQALRALAKRIAARIREAFDRVWQALIALGGGI